MKLAPSGFSDLSVSQIMDYMRESVIITDLEGTIQAVNPAFTATTGYAADEVVGKNPRILKSGRQSGDFYEDMWATLREIGHWQGEIWNRRKNDEIYLEWLTISAVRNEKDQVTHYLGVFTDITGRKLSEERLNRLALYDPLTSLPNRHLFRDRLSQDLAQAHRNDRMVALLFLDLDDFKRINDTFGHLGGDKLLAVMGGRLENCVRGGDTIARFGGDEFVAILPGVVHVNDAVAVAEKILKELSRPFHMEGRNICVTTSIGICFYPRDGRDTETLLQKADEAMYKAKERGRNNHQFFNDAIAHQ